MKKNYSYACENSGDCLYSLEGHEKGLSYVEFCNLYCANCPDCVVLDIPYNEFIEKIDIAVDEVIKEFNESFPDISFDFSSDIPSDDMEDLEDSEE